MSNRFKAIEKQIDLLSLITLAVICAAPTVYGCQPAWASGFLSAGILGLASIYLLHPASRITVTRPGGVWTSLTVAFFLTLVVYDTCASSSAMRIPDVSRLAFSYALSFLAAFILGDQCGSTGNSYRVALSGIFCSGFIMSLLSFCHWRGLFLTENVTYLGRLTAFSNPNRFAVFLTVCLTCGLGEIAAEWSDMRRNPSSPKTATVVRMTARLAAALFIAVCIIFTLSRGTLIAIAFVATLFGVGFSVVLRRDLYRFDPPPVSVYERFSRWVKSLIPVIVLVMMAGLCFAVGQNALLLRVRHLTGESEGRYQAWLAALPLVVQHPITGQGLGSFEALFTRVQPVVLEGRWKELHSDLLQLALEAGWPSAILVLILVYLWGRSVFRAVVNTYGTDKLAAFTLALPALGIGVALFCSLFDFPLREPATAMIVFLVAGAICRRRDEQVVSEDMAPGTSTIDSPRELIPANREAGVSYSTVAKYALVPLLLMGAYYSCRNALAWSKSPMMGHLYLSAYQPGDIVAWRSALVVESRDPELNYCLASSLANSGAKDARGEALGLLRKACEIKPIDYRFFWVAAKIESQNGNHENALTLGERADALAPQNTELQLWLGNEYLSAISRQAVPAHDNKFERAIWHLRRILSPGNSQSVANTLKTHGFVTSEVAQLWPGTDSFSRLRRAEFFLDEMQLNLAYQELIADPDPNYLCSYHMLKGSLFLKWERVDSGLAEWKLAVDCAPPFERGKADKWMASHLPQLNRELAEQIAGKMEDYLPQLHSLSELLAQSLVNYKSWYFADKVLRKSVNLSPRQWAAWAEVALAMNDFSEAKSRADFVLSSRAGDWTIAWYKEFLENLKVPTKTH